MIVNVIPPFDEVIVPPPPVTPVVAARTPLVSLSVAVKVSPLVVGDFESPTPVIATFWLCCTVAEPGAVIVNAPDCGGVVSLDPTLLAEKSLNPKLVPGSVLS